MLSAREVRKALASVELERSYSAPLQRAMAVFDLSSGEVADAMGVSRQAVDKWLIGGPPSDRIEKIVALAEIADILHYRLRPGTPPTVVRMPSGAYGDRSGKVVPHQQCQAVGQAALDAELDGIDCRSAATGGDRELAWFPRDRQAKALTKHTFDDWRNAPRTAS